MTSLRKTALRISFNTAEIDQNLVPRFTLATADAHGLYTSRDGYTPPMILTAN